MSAKMNVNHLAQVFPTEWDRNGMPELLYITKQQFGHQKRDRPMHSHDTLCEILLVYRGFGHYAIRNQSFPIQAGDILFYNQDEAHEVRDTYCMGRTGLQMQGLLRNHLIPADGHPVRPSGVIALSPARTQLPSRKLQHSLR